MKTLLHIHRDSFVSLWRIPIYKLLSCVGRLQEANQKILYIVHTNDSNIVGIRRCGYIAHAYHVLILICALKNYMDVLLEECHVD